MLIVFGRLISDRIKDFTAYRVTFSFSQRGEGGTSEKEGVVDATSDGAFSIGLPDAGEILKGVTIRVLNPDGEVVFDELHAPDLLVSSAGTEETPGLSLRLESTVAPIAAVPPRGLRGSVSGQVLDFEGRRLISGRQVVIFARAAGDLTSVEEAIVAVETNAHGGFRAEYLRRHGESLAEAYALVAGAVDVNGKAHLPIRIEHGELPERLTLVVRLDVDSELEAPCACDPPVPRAPGHEELTRNSAVYSADTGGQCVQMTVSNRAIEEFDHYLLVRLDDPQIAGRVPGQQPTDAPVTRRVLDGISPLAWYGKPDDVVRDVQIHQATTLARGHLLHFKQSFQADGYSLGDLLYSLPLAPLQKKQIAIFDWERREQGQRTEATAQQEALSDLLSRDRDVREIVGSSLREDVRGHSEGTTIGASHSSGAAGSGGNGSTSVGAVAGSSIGIGVADGSATQDGSRSLTASTLNQLRDRTQQSASAVRSKRTSVVQSVAQNEQVSVTTEVVGNYNHCHSLTIQYFEVLRHFRVNFELAAARECLLVPLLMSPFGSGIRNASEPDEVRRACAKLLKWRRPLQRNLLDPALEEGFVAIDRLIEGVPAGAFADDRLERVEGSLALTFEIARPADEFKDGIFGFAPSEWGFLNILLPGRSASEWHDVYLSVERKRDKIFQERLAPDIARAFIDTLEVHAHLASGERQRLPVDFSLVSTFRPGIPLHVTFRMRTPSSLRRTDVRAIQITPQHHASLGGGVALPRGSRVRVERAGAQYRTSRLVHALLADSAIQDDLLQNDGTVITTPLDALEQKSPRAEYKALAERLCDHLNANIEYYHSGIWREMDPARRYMLLDGFLSPDGKRSIASVVENRVVGVVGNSLVMPLSPGAFLADPTRFEGEPLDLLSRYQPRVPVPPIRLSLPTRGVFAEAVMGSCNACEVKDETRYWRFEESPDPDAPTSINQISTAGRRVDVKPEDTKARDLPPPIINIQSAPAAPDPTSLAKVLDVIKKGDIFPDLTASKQVGENSFAAFKKSLETGRELAKQASGLAKQQLQLNKGGIDNTLRSIGEAQASGLIDKKEAGALAFKALSSMIGDDPEASERLTDDPTVGKLLKSFSSSPSGKLDLQTGGERVKVEKGGDDAAGKAGSTPLDVEDIFTITSRAGKTVGTARRVKSEKPFFFLAKMSVDADGAPKAYNADDKKALDDKAGNESGIVHKSGQRVLNSKPGFEGFFVSQTALGDSSKADTDQDKYVDASTIPYVVLPGVGSHEARLGDLAAAYDTRTHRLAFAIFADIGPTTSLGEGSIKLAEMLDTYGATDPHDGRRGGESEQRVIYVVFPGSRMSKPWPRTFDDIQKSGKAQFEKWGGSTIAAAFARLRRLFPDADIVDIA